jgi:hypothetical protein
MGKMVLTVDQQRQINTEVFHPKNEILFIGTARQGESCVMVFGDPENMAKHGLLEAIAYDKERIPFKCVACGKIISFMEYETHDGLCDACTGV